MIIANGTLRVKTVTGGGLDNDGYPIPPSTSWGDPIDCNIKSNSKASVGMTDNKNVFKTSSYEVLIDLQSIDAGIISLVRDGVDLGEFQVQGKPEHLNIVRNTKLLVKCLLNA